MCSSTTFQLKTFSKNFCRISDVFLVTFDSCHQRPISAFSFCNESIVDTWPLQSYCKGHLLWHQPSMNDATTQYIQKAVYGWINDMQFQSRTERTDVSSFYWRHQNLVHCSIFLLTYLNTVRYVIQRYHHWHWLHLRI